MGKVYKVYDKRDKADKYTAKDNDTLEEIAKNYPAVENWKEIALYNWGTEVPREVNRALTEIIGVKELNNPDPEKADPGKTVLKPYTGAKTEILVPKLWKKAGYAETTRHPIKVKRLPRPQNAISITKLDKWFIPNSETCDISYQLEGLKETADKVAFEVYGSNYCECTAWNDGHGTYAALADTPVFEQATGNKADERTDPSIEVSGSAWKGQANASKGILSVKTGGNPRHVNVAFSPYTAHLRYYKDDGDKQALLALEPFWPLWEETKSTPAAAAAADGANMKVTWSNTAKADRGALRVTDKGGQLVHLAEIPTAKLAAGNQDMLWDKNYHPAAENSKFGKDYNDDSALGANSKDTPYTYQVTTIALKPKADSLKVKWEIKKATRLERGLLQVLDGGGKLVFQKGLPKGDVGQGKHEFAWDGKYLPGIKNSNNTEEVIPEDMPYRVQVQAHTGLDEDKGVALAAMHTEVRLYVAPTTRVPADALYDPWTAAASLALALGPLVPGDPPQKAAGTKWYQHQLALFGFHAGPVNGTKHDPYKIALKEFKRSVPKRKTGANYERLTIDENEDADTEAAIEFIEARYKRKPFGDLAKVLANNDDPDLTDNEVKANLPNVGSDIVLWADDRQYYTQGSSRDENNRDFFTGLPGGDANAQAAARAFGLNNYRGDFNIGDAKTDRDQEAIPRPWLPLQVDLTLLSKTKGLRDAGSPIVADGAPRDAMRAAIGPLRVDWTFDELPRDVSTIGAAAYDHDYARSRAYVAWAIAQNKGTHNRPDTGRQAIYTNCKKALGGVRPDPLATYYEKALGTGNLGLDPWKATAVAATQSVATVVHDHLLAGQTANTDLFTKLVGVAGAYFHPSNIAGDGYRARAEVQFEKYGSYDFPNLSTLKARYPVRPQAHSARLRVWRRSSIRGYMCWAAAATGHWPGHMVSYRNRYKAAHVYFVHEAATAPRAFNVTDVFDPAVPAHVTRYKNVVINNVADAFLKVAADMSLRAADPWPWGDPAMSNLGWPLRSDEGIAQADLYRDWMSRDVIQRTWRAYRFGLLYTLAKRAEELGIMRGHLLVEFGDTPPGRAVRHECDGATTHSYWYLRRQGAGNRPDQNCPAAGCAGTLRATPTVRNYPSGLPLPAVGGAAGATWLFTTSDEDTWAHEVGHHRHLEHSASGPGAKPNLHDSQQNTSVAAWPGGTTNDQKQWDRHCTMSYAASQYGSNHEYFCGRCLLRHRGWKVTGLGFPGGNVKEP